jgi:hypothetical protein
MGMSESTIESTVEGVEAVREYLLCIQTWV